MANKIKIGQIGICHEHASGKINTLKALPEIYEIVGIVDDRSTQAARFAGDNLEPYKDLKFMSEQELLDYPGLEAIVIETPNTDLVPTAMRCMNRNLPMHMDKPGGENLELFRQLRKGCQERKLPFQMGYMFRGNPAFQFCLKAVTKGWLGDIFEIQASMSHDYGGEIYQKYLSNFKGGIMFNLGCHLIDFVIKMLGRPQRIAPFLKSTAAAPNNSENNCLTIIEYPHTHVTLHACDSEIKGIDNRRLKICGTKGTIILEPLEILDGNPLKMRLILNEENTEYKAGNHTLDFGITRDRYKAQLIELAQMIHGKTENPYDYEHDLLVQEVVLAASGQIKWQSRI